MARFGYGLTTEECQGCGKSVFPDSPAKATKYLDSSDHKKRPEHVYCGHWFHYGCLDKFITRPPFGKPCPACKEETGENHRVLHKKFTSDISRLEKAWAMQQAHDRELADVADFMS